MANLSIRVDESTKSQAEIIANELGMNLTTATNVLLKQFVRYGGFPFDVRVDPFYNTSNTDAIKRSLAQLEQGKVIEKSLEEIEELANE